MAKTYQEAKVCKKHTDYKKHNDYKIPIPMLGNLNEKKLGKFFFLPKFKVSSHIKSLWVILFGDAVLSSVVGLGGESGDIVPADVQFPSLTFLVCGAR